MTTLIDKLKEGITPDYIKKIAIKEGITDSNLVSNIISGKVVVPRNNLHTEIEPIAIGKGTSVKINANIGTSPVHIDFDYEYKKACISLQSGADTIMDLSIAGDVNDFRKKITQELNITLGTVPIYRSLTKVDIPHQLSIDSFLEDMEREAEEKVDFMTIHAGLRKEHIPMLKNRKIGVVSRGGSALVQWMRHNEKENFLYENFDKILTMAKKYDITLSLGDALRPGCTADANDEAQFAELQTLSELTKRCRKANVQVIIEGPGHVPLELIEENIVKQKELCDEAPFYVLGPLVIDYAAGYDHIAGAIGGALASFFGADFLCYVTPAEHLRLPNLDDVKEGVIASKIAAAAADLSRKRKNELTRNLEMTMARKKFDWSKQKDLVIDEQKFSEYLEKVEACQGEGDGEQPCSMCGKLCAMIQASK